MLLATIWSHRNTLTLWRRILLTIKLKGRAIIWLSPHFQTRLPVLWRPTSLTAPQLFLPLLSHPTCPGSYFPHFICSNNLQIHTLTSNFLLSSLHSISGNNSMRGSDSKESACSAEDLGSILGWKYPPEKRKATHCRVLAWRIPWTEEPGGLRSLGSQRAGLYKTQMWSCHLPAWVFCHPVFLRLLLRSLTPHHHLPSDQISAPLEKEMATTPVLLPRKLHGWSSLLVYSPRGRKESDVTEWLHFH